jgi:hypothetical protein
VGQNIVSNDQIGVPSSATIYFQELSIDEGDLH